jgi:hypothetical protein
MFIINFGGLKMEKIETYSDLILLPRCRKLAPMQLQEEANAQVDEANKNHRKIGPTSCLGGASTTFTKFRENSKKNKT